MPDLIECTLDVQEDSQRAPVQVGTLGVICVKFKDWVYGGAVGLKPKLFCGEEVVGIEGLPKARSDDFFQGFAKYI